nr:hypothetical protein [Tanacetum cinerariifolium]
IDQPNPTFAKILILDTGKFKQWKFRIQQYLQNEHYALWEVIEFGDSYKTPPEETGKGPASESLAKKKGRTVVITTEDMHKKRNDVKEAILKTFGRHKATKMTKKNQLKQQYGNFKAEGSETLEQTFNRLQAIVSYLEFIGVEIEQDDLNQKFLTSLTPEWLIYTIVWRNRDDLDTMSLDDVGKGKVHTASVLTASIQVSTASTDVGAVSLSHDTVCHFARECKAPRSQNKGKRESYKQGPNEEELAPKALMAIDGIGWDWSYMANEEKNHALVADDEVPTEFALMAKGLERDVEVRNNKIEYLMNELEQVKKEKEGLDNKLAGFESASKDVDNLLGSHRSNKNKEGLGYNAVSPPPPAQVYSPPKKDLSWTGLPEFVDDTITDYSRPTPSIDALKCNTSDLQSSTFSVSEHGKSSGSIMTKPMIKFVKAVDCPRDIKTNNIENARKSTVKYAKIYKNISKSPKVRGNISYLSEYEPYDRGYVSFGQGGGKITGKQHKASCKTKLVNSISKPLHTLHMDLFRPTSASSLNHKWYCLVVTDDFSRCDNGGDFKNKEINEFCTKKGIRREFSNARTPQQNRVAKRRNRTLIEAARTMLTDAKLPITFWAEVVNTACYVQNRVLVNKSQNKTSYEIFNSRILAIGFLRPFGCHVMILNTLDHLIKFDAKGDEGYFVRNISTNISGTKDVASQDVKKDVSSLRYIALLNWFHEAHMETRNSDAPDGCNADDPESSGILNPTATSKVPLADQVEPAVSLTVESEIPTVSSHVPTVYLDFSFESSSGPRLISKGDLSQKEAPSLGNALTLSNRFEDTFGMEADLSNMETSIPVSPTPTFRIHKDHQKSQIIGPVDTPVQTRHKSKEMEEQSFIATIHQKTNPDLLKFFARIEAIKLFLAYALFMGFIVYQMDVKSAFLYSTIDEEVYVMHPPGFQDPEFPNRTLFIEKHKGEFLLVQVYVDDIIFGSSNPQLCREFEALMHDKFQMSAMGELTFFLGLQVLQKKDGILLLQDKYVGDILKKFGYSDVRPDIMFAVCACARHQVTPKECHLYVVKRIFRYLKGHPKLGLWYAKESPFDLVAYSDSDYGGATQDKKLTTGAEAEYVAAASGCRQVLWIQNQLLDYGSDSEQRTHEFMHVYLVFASAYVWIGNFLMAKLAFCDYHNMVAILEKTEHNIDFHQIVDFIEASHIRYALTISPIVYVSHIRQFWSTARIKTTNQETKILATVEGKPRTISESSLRWHLKLNDEEGISSLPDSELFENLSLMGYNILPNQSFTFQKGQFSHQWKFLIHTIMQCLSLKSTGFNEFSSNIATAVGEGSANPTEPYYTPSPQELHSPHHDSPPPSHPTITSELISQAPTEPLTHRKYTRRAKGIMEIWEELGANKSTELGSNDTEDMVNVLSSMEATNILTSGGATASVSPADVFPAIGVPIVSGSFPTRSAIFTTASVVTPYTRRLRGITIGSSQHMRSPIIGAKDKGKEKVIESEVPKKRKLQEQIDAQVAREMEEEYARENQRLNEQLASDSEIARLYAEEELKMMIEGLDRNNEVITKHLREYEQAVADLSVGEKLELISELVKYQDHQESERVKRQGIKIDQGSSKRIKTSKSVSEDVSEEELMRMMELVPLEEVYVEALQGGSTSAMTLVKETFSIRQATKDKEKELWVELKRLFEPDFEDQLWTHNQAFMHDPLDWKLYDTCGVHHVFTKDQEIFMLVEKDYPLRKGLTTVIIIQDEELIEASSPGKFYQCDEMCGFGKVIDNDPDCVMSA